MGFIPVHKEQNQIRALDFNSIIRESIHALRFLDGAYCTEINYSVENDSAFYSDPKLIAIIFNNIISNAINFRNRSGKKSIVDINIFNSSDKCIINIKDNGIGINKDDQQKVFELFYRKDNNRHGSGMGLYIVKEIITKLNGKIAMESVENGGTDFIIEIPNLMQPSYVIEEQNNFKSALK